MKIKLATEGWYLAEPAGITTTGGKDHVSVTDRNSDLGPLVVHVGSAKVQQIVAWAVDDAGVMQPMVAKPATGVETFDMRTAPSARLFHAVRSPHKAALAAFRDEWAAALKTKIETKNSAGSTGSDDE